MRGAGAGAGTGLGWAGCCWKPFHTHTHTHTLFRADTHVAVVFIYPKLMKAKTKSSLHAAAAPPQSLRLCLPRHNSKSNPHFCLVFPTQQFPLSRTHSVRIFSVLHFTLLFAYFVCLRCLQVAANYGATAHKLVQPGSQSASCMLTN